MVTRKKHVVVGPGSGCSVGICILYGAYHCLLQELAAEDASSLRFFENEEMPIRRIVA